MPPTISHYEIREKIGQGGMGVVYRALDLRLNRAVAIKVIAPSALGDAKRVRRFVQEARAASAFSHPNVAHIYEIGEADGVRYIAMEYVEGTPLNVVISERRFDLPEILDIAIQTAGALSEAHAKGITHRDIKPGNMMLTGRGQVKIIDFGLAKLAQQTLEDVLTGVSTDVMTQPGMIIGTVRYMSPEQALGREVDHRTDIFSLGAVLYEMATGRPPFKGASATETIDHILHSQPEPITFRGWGRGWGAQSELEIIIRKCLEKQPEHRYQAADELGKHLRDLKQQVDLGLSLRAKARFGWHRHRRAAPWLGFACLMIAAIVGAAYYFRGFSRPQSASIAVSGTEQTITAIAVLPLENSSHDPQQEYFVDGMTDAIIAGLSKVNALRVISRTSVMTYKGKNKPLAEIARELRVQAAVQGSAMRSGDGVRLTLKLVDASANRQIWAGTYERPVRDVAVLQNEAAMAIAREIRVPVTERDRARLDSAGAVNQQAYDFYLKGRYQYFSEFNRESIQRAMAFFREALAADPLYAPAYAGMADCYYMLSAIYYPPKEVMPKAKWAAQKALEIDKSLGEAQASLALVQSVYDLNRKEAERGFLRAIELNPNDVLAHLWYAMHLLGMGRGEEALRELERARELDPLSPGIDGYVSGAALYFLHKYDQMIERLRPMVDMNPDQSMPHAFLALAYEQRREYDKAISAFLKAHKLDDQTVTLAQLGHVYAVSGRTIEAESILARLKALSRERYVSAYDIAVLYAGLGRKDEAFQWLEKFDEDRSEWFALLRVDPRLDQLRSDPRFQRLLTRIDPGL